MLLCISIHFFIGMSSPVTDHRRMAYVFGFAAYCSMILCWSELCSATAQRRHWMNWKLFTLCEGTIVLFSIIIILASSLLPSEKQDSIVIVVNLLVSLIMLAL